MKTTITGLVAAGFIAAMIGPISAERYGKQRQYYGSPTYDAPYGGTEPGAELEGLPARRLLRARFQCPSAIQPPMVGAKAARKRKLALDAPGAEEE